MPATPTHPHIARPADTITPSRLRRHSPILHNIVWNWAGTITSLLVGLWTVPFLIGHLGNDTYGIWILVASLTEYLGFLDLGIRHSLVRHVALHLARQDQRAVNETVSSGIAILTVVGCFAAPIVIVLVSRFMPTADIHTSLASDTTLIVALIGTSLLCSLILNSFDATLWAFQRLDLANAVDILRELLRAILMLVVLTQGFSLVALAWVVMTTTLLAGGAKLALTFHCDRALRISPALVSGRCVATLLRFGTWSLVRTIATNARRALPLFLIGSMASLSLVAPLSVSTRLVTYVSSLLAMAATVLTPLATTHHAADNRAGQLDLFLKAARLTCAASVLSTAYLFFMSHSLLALWIGPAMALAAPAVIILAVGELLPMSQLAAEAVLQGMAKHPALALASVIEVLAAAVAIASLGASRGLLGVVVVLAVCAACFRGLFTLLYASRVLALPLRRSLTLTVVTPSAFALLPCAVLAGLLLLHTPDSWALFALYSGIFAICSCIALAALQQVATPAPWRRGPALHPGRLSAPATGTVLEVNKP